MLNFESMEVRHYFWLATAAAVLTIVLKTLAWWTTGSVGLLSDAMESFVNLAGATFALWMVTIAKCPPDDNHQLGHGKAEYFSAGFEGVLILGAAAAIIWSAGLRLLEPQPLEGSSRHLMTDVWTSAGVVVGLILVGATGWLWLDAVVAILVGLHILWEGWALIRTSAHGLMDAALSTETVADIEGVLNHFAERGVSFANLRTRRAGADSFVYVDVRVPPEWTIVHTHDLLDEIETAVHRMLPGARVFTHPEPLQMG